MLKQTLFLILLLFIAVSEASARSFTLSHEDFIHLSDQEKDQLIIKTMELAIEVESRYQKDLETYGFNQNRYEKYVKALSTLSQLFIDEAHADTSKDWSAIGKDFIQLLKRPDSRCMFAGWISTPSKISPTKTVCNHPTLIGKSAPEAKAYPAPQKGSDCKANDPKKIQCSPVLFGYKKEADQSLFCVDATDGAHNSSYNCMKEALAEGDSQKGDPKETRLKNLRDRLAKNPEIFKGVQEFTYKTCVCDETDKNVKFNKEYHDYMRPHRTCYGLMEMMGETITCEDPKLPMDVSIFKSLRDYSKNQVVKGSDADALYKNFLKTEVMKSAPEEYKRICSSGSGDGGGENPEASNRVVVQGQIELICTGSCTPGKDKDSAFECDYEVTNYKKDKTYTFETHPTEIPKSKDDKTVEVNNKINGKERKLSCDITFPSAGETDTKKPTLKIEYANKGDKEYKIKATITDKGEWEIVWKTIKSVKKDAKKVEVSSGPKVTATTDLNNEKDAPKEKPEEPKPQAEENVTEGDKGATEISRTRESDKYKVCAELVKGTEKTGNTCLDVDPIGKTAAAPPAKPTPRPGPFPGTGMPMPQMPIRGSSDASALGIK